MSLPELDQPFQQPWHAELFAMTHALAAAGVFEWKDWTEAFGTALANADHAGAPRDGSTYYEIWLEAFQHFLAECGLADAAALGHLRDAWRDAYLSTPHGQPVTLS